MGKGASILAAGVLLAAGWLVPGERRTARAQSSAPAISCSGQTISSPMQGHYTGPWHSDGDYHFSAFNTDIELKITIDGTLDLTVDGSGRVTGTATGQVNAPIYDNGRQDISSGIGTISGTVTGEFSGSGSLLVLSQPTIDMHWGTFGGGHAVERFITMPDYQLPESGLDCVSSQGTIAEKDFPVQNIVPDGTNLPAVQAPGVGSASGTWQVTSDAAAHFHDLSQQVDSFISQASASLNGASSPLTVGAFNETIIQPLKSLEAAIEADPSVARCLLERLGAWEASVIPTLFGRAQSLADTSDLGTLRQAADLLRMAQALNNDCALSDGGAGTAVTRRQRALLDQAIGQRDWVQTALLMRESLLLQGPPAQAALPGWVGSDLRTLLHQTGNRQDLLTLARVAYALGDDADSSAAYQQLSSHARALRSDAKAKPRKKHKKKVAKKAPTATPTPSPTPVPAAKTLLQVLYDGMTKIDGQTNGSPTTFSWQPVSGAERYLVFATATDEPGLLWSWSGSGTSVTYGDTSLEGVTGSQNDGWPLSLSASRYTWSVVALDNQGHVIGLLLRDPSA